MVSCLSSESIQSNEGNAASEQKKLLFKARK